MNIQFTSWTARTRGCVTLPPLGFPSPDAGLWEEIIFCCSCLVTWETPSTNFVLNNTLALLYIPSLRETSINWDVLNLVFSSFPIFWVCDKSSAASTSSNMYMGAGLNCKRARMRDKAIKDRCPPDNSVREDFQTPPRHTLISRPWVISLSWGGSSLHVFPGNKSPNIAPKSLQRWKIKIPLSKSYTHSLCAKSYWAGPVSCGQGMQE